MRLLSLGGIRGKFYCVDLYNKKADVIAPIWDTRLDGAAWDWIEALHVLEHCPFRQVVPALDEIRRLLAPEGSAAIMVPDATGPFQLWLEEPSFPPPAAIFGSQTNEGQFHKTAFSPSTIAKVVSDAGLAVRSVEHIDRRPRGVQVSPRRVLAGDPTPAFRADTSKIREGILVHATHPGAETPWTSSS